MRLSSHWQQMIITPKERWFSPSRYETTTRPGSWLCWSDLMLQNPAGSAHRSYSLIVILLSALQPDPTHTHWHISRRLCRRDALHSVFDEVRVVDVMDSGDVAHLSLMKRPDLGVTFTKLHCWTLTHYSKCVFMDADTLVRSTLHEKQQSLENLLITWI